MSLNDSCGISPPLFLEFIISLREKYMFNIIVWYLEKDKYVFHIPICILLALCCKICRIFLINICEQKLLGFVPSQNSKLIYRFGSISLKPMHGNGAVYLTVLAHYECEVRGCYLICFPCSPTSTNHIHTTKLVMQYHIYDERFVETKLETGPLMI